MGATLSRHLRQIRGNRSKVQFAELAHVSRDTITAWENNAAKPKPGTILHICKTLNLDEATTQKLLIQHGSAEAIRLLRCITKRPCECKPELRSPLGTLLAGFRIQNSIPQAHLAHKLGVSTKTIQRVERGWQQISPEMLENWLNALSATELDRSLVQRAEQAPDRILERLLEAPEPMSSEEYLSFGQTPTFPDVCVYWQVVQMRANLDERWLPLAKVLSQQGIQNLAYSPYPGLMQVWAQTMQDFWHTRNCPSYMLSAIALEDYGKCLIWEGDLRTLAQKRLPILEGALAPYQEGSAICSWLSLRTAQHYANLQDSHSCWHLFETVYGDSYDHEQFELHGLWKTSLHIALGEGAHALDVCEQLLPRISNLEHRSRFLCNGINAAILCDCKALQDSYTHELNNLSASLQESGKEPGLVEFIKKQLEKLQCTAASPK